MFTIIVENSEQSLTAMFPSRIYFEKKYSNQTDGKMVKTIYYSNKKTIYDFEKHVEWTLAITIISNLYGYSNGF